MPEIRLKLKDGRMVALAMPEPGAAPSAFLLSLHKAGSTLFYRLMAPIATRAGLPYFSLPNTLHDLGIPVREIAGGLKAVFQPTGYTYGGYRGVEPRLQPPPYADGRTVVLVRDPRDMLTSLYFSEAKSHVPPGNTASDVLLKQFEERRRRALATSIDEFVLARAAGVRNVYGTVLAAVEGRRHQLFRYEDVIFDKLRWMNEVIGYLGLNVPDQLVRTVVERNDIRPASEDESKHIRKVAPGDHRDKLRPETIAQLDRAFAEVLARFGYERGEASSAVPAQTNAPGLPERLHEQRRAEKKAARLAERLAARGG